MQSLFDTLTSLQQGELPAAMSRELGASEGATRSAMSAALPLLLGALARNTTRPEGAQALASALERDHDGHVLDDLPGAVRGAPAGPGDGILRHVLGAQRPALEAQLSQRSGLDSASVSRLLSTLAPLVMGALGRSQRERRLDPSGLAEMLRGEGQRAAQAAPADLGWLGQLLDSDRDGQIGDDVARLGGGLLRRLFRGRR